MDAYTAPGVLPEGVLLTCSTGVYGHSVSKHLFAMLLALMKRLPQYRDQQRQAQWRDLGQARSLLDAEVLMVGTGDLGTSFARLCRALGAHTTGGDHLPDTARRIAAIALGNLGRYLRGKPLRNQVR